MILRVFGFKIYKIPFLIPRYLEHHSDYAYVKEPS